MKNKLAILIFVLSLWGVPMFAQADTTPTPDAIATEEVAATEDIPVVLEAPADSVVEVNLDLVETTDEVGSTVDFASALLALGIFMPSAVGLMTFLTSVVKYIGPDLPSARVNLVLSTLLIGFFSVVKFTGVDSAALDKTLESLTVIGYSVLTIVGAGIVSPKLYRASRDAKVPIIGFSLTPSVPPTTPQSQVITKPLPDLPDR